MKSTIKNIIMISFIVGFGFEMGSQLGWLIFDFVRTLGGYPLG
jgi:hypothetical protein